MSKRRRIERRDKVEALEGAVNGGERGGEIEHRETLPPQLVIAIGMLPLTGFGGVS